MTPEERLEQVNKLTNSAKDRLDIEESIRGILDEQNKSISSFFTTQSKIRENKKQQQAVDSTITKLAAEYAEIAKTASADQAEKLKSKIQELEVMKKLSNTIKEETVVLEKNASFAEAMARSAGAAVSGFLKSKFELGAMWNYLQDIDGVIRKTQLSLGVSGNKAAMMREQFEGSVNAAARFGASAKDIGELQSSITDLTGKATAFRKEDNLSLVAIVKGTGMQNAEAAKLVGTMENYGLSISSSKKLIEGSVNSTAKLGLSSNAVLKKVIANIDKLNSYRFDNGVKGIMEMAQSAEKFGFSMEGAFAAADKFRTLGGLLQAGAELRVLGGEFAKMDEFKLSFLARNKPKEFAEEMAKLTKGMATFNKETGEFDVSDVDYDRLRVVAESTGRSIEDVIKSTKRFNQVNFAKKQIFAGVNDADREMIATLATFKPGSTIGQIKIGDKDVDIDKLTDTQIGLLKQQQKTLEERAKDSQNFNESFDNTITQLKATLLPLLTYINSALVTFNGFIDRFRDSSGALNGMAALIPIGGLLLGIGGGAIITGLTRGLFSLVGSGIGKLFGGMDTKGGSGGMSVFTSGLKNLAGVGVAAVGIGAGMYLAAKGVAALAEAFSKLNTNQLIGINVALVAMGATMAGIAYFAPALGAAAPEIALFAGSLALLGGAVLLAGVGIGEMFKGIASMWNTENINFTGIEALGAVDFNNMDKLKVLQNFKQSDVDRMQEMFNVLNQINSIDTSKLSALQSIFSNMSLKFTLDGDAVLKSTVNVDFGGQFGEKLTKFVDSRVPIAMKKGLGAK